MRCVIITVAGVSGRFNLGEKEVCLKCIYHRADKRKTLLYSILKKCISYDKIVLVAGFQAEALQEYVESVRHEFPFVIQIVRNPYFEQYGSGYSLFLGIKECVKSDCMEILFAEGDLFFDKGTFLCIQDEDRSCLTVNRNHIYSNKAVAVYKNAADKFRYIYNTKHGLFVIKEAFSAIFNSGQVWKIKNMNAVNQVMAEMSDQDWMGTNLVFIEKYFEKITAEEIAVIDFKEWMNCNTREDYARCEEYL